MEEKVKSSSKNHIIIEVTLLVIILGLGIYIAYSKGVILTKEKLASQGNLQEETKTDSIAKIYTNKEYIYDAEYEKNVNKDSYVMENKTYYAKDIIVPFINIKSASATSANNEIKNVFDQAIVTYNTGSKFIEQCNYTKYIDNKTLSIVLTYSEGATDVVHPQYYTYNINLNDGKSLTYEEVCSLLEIENIDSKVEEAVTNIMREKLQSILTEENDNIFNTYNNESINNYKESVKNNTIKYFITENKKLNIVVKLSIPAGTGEFDTIISIN